MQNHLTLAAWTVSGISTTSRLSEAAQGIYCTFWGEDTAKSYKLAWGKWFSWCYTRKINPFQASTYNITKYLINHFQEGREYNTTNTNCSMLSAILPLVDGSMMESI